MEAKEVDGRATRRFAGTVVCREPGCEEPARGAGLCTRHYQALRYDAKREKELPEEYRAERCTLEGCENPQYANKLCRKHEVQYRRNGPSLYLYTADVNFQRVRMAMLLRGITYEDLAGVLGLSQQRVHQIVRGGRGWRKDYFDAVVETLDVPVAWLFKDGPPTFDWTK